MKVYCIICNEFLSENDSEPKEAISHGICLTCEEKYRKEHGLEVPASVIQISDFTDGIGEKPVLEKEGG